MPSDHGLDAQGLDAQRPWPRNPWPRKSLAANTSDAKKEEPQQRGCWGSAASGKPPRGNNVRERHHGTAMMKPMRQRLAAPSVSARIVHNEKHGTRMRRVKRSPDAIETKSGADRRREGTGRSGRLACEHPHAAKAEVDLRCRRATTAGRCNGGEDRSDLAQTEVRRRWPSATFPLIARPPFCARGIRTQGRPHRAFGRTPVVNNGL